MTSSWSGDRRSMPGRVAAMVRKRDGVCVRCGSAERLEVDHQVPVAEARLMGWSESEIDSVSNGQLLCHDCHSKKTRGEIARGLARRRAKPTPKRHPGLVA